MYRNIESLCCVTGTNSILGQLHSKNINKLIGKDMWPVVTGVGGLELDKENQEVQTSSYKINN